MAFDEDKQRDKIAKLQQREEEDLTRLLAQKYKTPYLNLSRISIDLDALRLIPEAEARDAGIAIIQVIGKKLQVAVKNPNLDSVKEVLDLLHRSGYTAQV
ncbi:MAG: hypothetical protein AAB482_01175, partial [Patescibacteria group bacterium]